MNANVLLSIHHFGKIINNAINTAVTTHPSGSLRSPVSTNHTHLLDEKHGLDPWLGGLADEGEAGPAVQAVLTL